MKQTYLAFLLLLFTTNVFANPVNIKFSNSLPVTKSSFIPGCETSAYGYVFDVTMVGYKLPKTTCTATNLFSVPDYLTVGKAGTATTVGATLVMTAPAGTTFELIYFTINDYGLKNNLFVDVTDSLGRTTTQAIKTYAGNHLYQFSGLTDLVSVQVRSANNRFDITAIQIVENVVP